ncbi:MAG TPA: YciI family protein [Acidimicrobiales bacterium]|nr:YciI family protein [Acidimicrobiales bacterium]
MRYLLLVCGDDAEQLTPVQAEERLDAYTACEAEMKARGAFVSRERLRPASTATTVRVRDGGLVLADGPFAETKEQIAGYFLVECADLDEAVDLASLVPATRYSMVEVRPVWEM